MSFDWTEYLTLARELTEPSPTHTSQESRLRSAISRAYYAAFIQARNHLRDKEGIRISSVQSHQFVIKRFLHSPDGRRKRVGHDLYILREDRNKADYDDTVNGLPLSASRALVRATRVIFELARL
jgi:uncharacterized protein (UPF0332 family)